MKAPHCLAAFCLLVAAPAGAQQVTFQDALLDKFAGTWVLEGTMAGGKVVHDIEAEWVLGHQYLRIHEIAREVDAEGAPAYEAIVFIGWDDRVDQYTNLWLDVTGAGGLNGEGIGRADKRDDELAFFFVFPDGSPWHTTFTYDRADDSWRWHMEGEPRGAAEPFTLARMTRR